MQDEKEKNNVIKDENTEKQEKEKLVYVPPQLKKFDKLKKLIVSGE